jgi:succinyl-CoA synthetase beta subunit
MNIHEYQAKEILKKFGIPTPEGYPAFSVPEAVSVAKQLEANGNKIFVVRNNCLANYRFNFRFWKKAF